MTLWIYFFLVRVVLAADVRVCDGIVFSRPIAPSLDSVERRLVCGDPQAREAWRRVPFNQAEFHLKTFLQARGYQQVRFERGREILKVLIEDPTRVTKVFVTGAPPQLDVSRRRGLIGSTLNPDKLNDLEAWVTAELMNQGYPCPSVSSQAHAITGEVTVTVKTGPQRHFGVILEEPTLLNEGTLSRYRAFQSNQLFDERLLTLTARRAVSEGTVQSVRFEPQCKANPFSIRQTPVIGPPRVFSFGFGFNTEEYFLVRTTWTHSRLGKMASPLDVRAMASVRHQELETNWKWYILDFPSRFYLRPSLSLSREKGKYETVSVKVRFIPSYDWDFPSFFVSVGAGPSVDQTQTIEGVGPGLTQLLLIETQTELISHDFEFYRGEPRQGTHLLLKTAHMARDAVSKTNATQVQLSGQWLGNYAHFDPPLLIFGMRFGLYSTLAESKEQVTTLLPPQFRYFLGGIATLRGFARQELPHNGTGAMTAAFAGAEMRSTGILPQNLQPYLFADVGRLGDQSLSLNQELFWSPGLGLRWNSPVGVFRLNASHGYVTNREASTPEGISHWQFYLAYGEEF
jgi:translocation and assembly module TamA